MRRIIAICVPILAMFATVFASSAQARTQDLCTWTQSFLPLPVGVTGGSVQAAGPNGYLAGQATDGTLLLWHNGEVVPINAPVSSSIRVSAVNGSGTIVGWDGRSDVPFVYRDGTFQNLSVPAGSSTFASAVNETGDIVGTTFAYATDYRSVVWKLGNPGSYQIVANDVAVGIDDVGNVVTEKGLVWSPNGTTSRLPSSPDLVVQIFQRGYALGHDFTDDNGLRVWDATGTVVHRFELARHTPIGINSQGQLAAWYTPEGSTVTTLGVWRGETFVGNVPGRPLVHAVAETGELVGLAWPAGATKSAPATWTCS
ncbi:hypothetical protein [Amycolatopsis plumensis]|uniref:Uncharacterized protein n=1 Tax=Amycolatopsis plumensis TaxID=236508 RepID=A0ABV5U5X6_9PSEU